jgi:hypothetical protein
MVTLGEAADPAEVAAEAASPIGIVVGSVGRSFAWAFS